jgi:RNA polymerase sigma factor (sigma-70 family)
VLYSFPMPNQQSDELRWFTEEVQPHEAALRDWLRFRFPSLGDRDDLVQQSYLQIIRARERTHIFSVRAFLFATARNLALNQLRRRAHEPSSPLGETDSSSVLDDKPDAAETIARTQELEVLTQAILSLPKRCREVFTLRRIAGLPQKEIAARLGISEKTVEAQCVIAMRKCVDYFRRTDGAPAAPPSQPGPAKSPCLIRPRNQLD